MYCDQLASAWLFFASFFGLERSDEKGYSEMDIIKSCFFLVTEN